MWYVWYDTVGKWAVLLHPELSEIWYYYLSGASSTMLSESFFPASNISQNGSWSLVTTAPFSNQRKTVDVEKTNLINKPNLIFCANYFNTIVESKSYDNNFINYVTLQNNINIYFNWKIYLRNCCTFLTKTVLLVFQCFLIEYQLTNNYW